MDNTTSRIIGRCKSGFGFMKEGFQNNQALPWEFRDPEKVQQPSNYVLEIPPSKMFGSLAPQKKKCG